MHSAAVQHATTDAKSGAADAALLAKLASWPEAFWFTGGTPTQVAQQVGNVVAASRTAHAVPVLVAYDIPRRDCGLHSSGGARSDAAYQEWIAAFAKAIGNSRAVVILEPDALANLPKDCGVTSDPVGAVSAARVADINAAVSDLEAQPQASVYLDGGSSNWLPVAEITGRLLGAGVRRAQGFFLNVSNYQATDRSDRYGTWVSKCLWYAGDAPNRPAGQSDRCADQNYSSAAPNDGRPGNAVSSADPSTWRWIDAWYDTNVGAPSAAELTHFVVDTSRNGQGGWSPPPGTYPDTQNWCNAPGRGVGVRPTATTGVPLIDAYLYVKTIGLSDGPCTRGTAGPGDPAYGGAVDPPAGTWWPAQALTLARNANPALTLDLGTRG